MPAAKLAFLFESHAGVSTFFFRRGFAGHGREQPYGIGVDRRGERGGIFAPGLGHTPEDFLGGELRLVGLYQQPVGRDKGHGGPVEFLAD